MGQQVVCANCGIIIRWQPTIIEGKGYCCLGCAQGGPCECDYDNLPQPGAANPIVVRTEDDRHRRGTG
jgi:hypothetical protein